ncbi:MAG TPA: formylglycine-generating enzyme family protein, partial [Bacteroidetes bacterium]|nr:formylglycine-generating enzyme family protein [Bacteroidota bacterium]
ALALERAKAKQKDGLFGSEISGVLAPEVVFCDSLWVGRFEVTRAQYAAFDPEYQFQAGTGNYPASGISYEKAKAYCRWLSEKTGQTYRLPTEKELKKLLARAKGNADHENNLDYWAGYDVNPDDARMLAPKIHELEQKGSLLWPVGSFRPVGKNRVYDLGGNVAEWCTAGDSGKVLGGSAVTPKDPAAKYQAPPLRYVGFRVILEK